MDIYSVESINKVDTTRYIEGDFFITKQTIGVLHNGKIERLIKQSDLKDFVKKKDVKKIVEEMIKEGEK